VKKKTKVILIVAAGLIALIVLFYYYHIRNQSGGQSIKVSGNIEATEVRLSFQVGGRIAELFTDEGMFVKKGQIVAVLDKDELAKVRNEAMAHLGEAKSNYQTTEKDYIRAEGLFQGGVMTAQQRDIAKNNFDVASAKLKSAEQSLALASVRLSYTDLNSPLDSFVLVKSAEAGEVVQPGSTVFTLADLNDIWLTAYISETDLGRVKLNQQADIKTDTYPGKVYKGRISFISQEAEFTPKQIQTTRERVKLVYRIKITVENPNLELKPGMPADGYIIE
jgi:HlyD family secretion protein